MKKHGALFLILSTFITAASFSEESKPYRIVEPKHKNVGLYGVYKEPTVQFRNKYLEPANRMWLAEVLYDSIPYRPYIRARLKAKNMPMYIQYLPIVESNYKPSAVSPSGATGMWQFMANSMSPFLKRNAYYDERRDPWLETDAALSKLCDNYKMFGDWELALAAYNMGAGAVSRARKAHPGKDFWYLAEHGYLSKQASEYVPKLIAFADIIENADYYGAIEIGVADKRISGVKPTSYDYIKITGCIKLETISSKTGIPLQELKFLNPALLKGCTPPKETYRLRLPKGTAKDAAQKLGKK